MSTLYVFGAGQIAETCAYYFAQERPQREIVFVVDSEYFDNDTLDGRPVVPYQEAIGRCSVDVDRWFTAVSYRKRNTLRQAVADRLTKAGVAFESYVHPTAQTWSGFQVPTNSMIMESNLFQYKSSLGANSIVWSNNHIGHHSSVGRNAFIASEVVVSGNCSIGDNVFLGVNATIIDGIEIGDLCAIGAGAVVKGPISGGTSFA